MIFNSIEFALFLPVVFLLYWFIFQRNLRSQNFFLLSVSYIFYGWWDWRFLFLIMASSVCDYTIGLWLGDGRTSPRKRKSLLFISCGVNLGFLGFFKYYSFFADSLVAAFASINIHLEPRTLHIILPVGISFYTFQTLSYTIDIYRRQIKPTRDIVAFFAYVSFFPQLVAGPIERASRLLPQFEGKRQFEIHTAKDGLRQILWGFFKKIVIADNCAIYVNRIFENPESYNSSTLVLGTIYFAFQIYGDFSGYSDIAIGTSRLFGFRLMQNFSYPYFSRDIAEFWRRWHISLSSWFRDYLYIPLGGSRGTRIQIIKNICIVFLISGLWHGANWTFLVWGALHAAYFVPLLLIGKHRNHLDFPAQGRWLPSPREIIQIATTFALVTLGWIFFRAENVSSAITYLSLMLSESLLTNPFYEKKWMLPIMFIAILVIVEWLNRDKPHGLSIEHLNAVSIRWGIYLVVLLMIYFMGASQQSFIYFQF